MAVPTKHINRVHPDQAIVVALLDDIDVKAALGKSRGAGSGLRLTATALQVLLDDKRAELLGHSWLAKVLDHVQRDRVEELADEGDAEVGFLDASLALRYPAEVHLSAQSDQRAIVYPLRPAWWQERRRVAVKATALLCRR